MIPPAKMPTSIKAKARPKPDGTERPPRKRLGVEERRAQLVELGIEAFSSRAYDEVSIDDVAASAGISKGLLYHYYPTKRDFYVATIQAIASQLLVATDTGPGVDSLKRLRVGLEAYFQFVERHGAAYSSLLRGGIGVDSEAVGVVEGTRTAFVDRLLSSIDFGHVSPLARTTVRGWIGFVEATSLEWVDRRDVSQDELVTLWSNALIWMITPYIG
jgi:AcrR family transcriptional regulator